MILIVVACLIFENTRPSHAYILFSININFIVVAWNISKEIALDRSAWRIAINVPEP